MARQNKERGIGVEKYLASIIISIVAALGVLCSAIPAYAGFTDFDSAFASKPDEMKYIYQKGKSYGFSDEAVLGIMANMNQESGFNIAADNGLGCVGLVQYCSTRAGTFKSAVPEWKTDYKKSVDYIWKEIAQGGFMAGMPDLANMYISDGGVKDKCSPATLDDFKKLKSVSCAVAVFTGGFERPGPGSTSARVAFGEELKKGLSKLSDGKVTDDSSDEKDNESQESNKDDSTTNSDDGKISEKDLTGMPNQNDYTQGGNTPQTLPETKDLSAADTYSLAMLKDARTLESQTTAVQAIRTGIMLVGFLIFFYGIALMMAVLFDKANTVFEFSLLGVVTFGRMNLVSSRFDVGKSRVTLKRAVVSAVVCWVLAAFVLSGVFGDWFLNAWWFLQDHTSIFG